MLEFRKVNKQLSNYNEVLALMDRAFPISEQNPTWLLNFVATNKNTKFYAYFDDGAFCGISYTVENDNMIFVLYLAVNDAIRSKGYGSRIIELIKNSNPSKVVTLNVERIEEGAPNLEQRIRRINFYKRNGFIETNKFVKNGDDIYLIMSTGEFKNKDYRSLLKRFSFGLYAPKVIEE